MIRDGVVTRQIQAAGAVVTTSSASYDASADRCTAALPSGATLVFNDTYTTTLGESITFETYCNSSAIFRCDSDDVSGNSTIIGAQNDPFYASVTPMVYALGTATILSYLLVILIFITPRTFYVGGPGGGAGFLGARSMVPGSGSTSVIGVGRRPLLQKIATVTVAISLTIATADTFNVAEDQYNSGLMDSQKLVTQVIGSTEIRVVRVISDTFLWLAQVQTLIRLFPRHKEKVTIKWLGFALVTLDAIFSVLENFVSQTTRTNPQTFHDAIPALSYLFELSISLIYASCVAYYSLSKRRFAFWHSKMRNILLVAILSLASVLVPVVFFILDISSPGMATWGEYIRWVGAAAASVVVWEWVERIEALERDERKDGILGREIFDGDEMLDVTPSDSSVNKGKRHYFGSDSKGDEEAGKTSGTVLKTLAVRSRLPNLRRRNDERKSKERTKTQAQGQTGNVPKANGSIARPPQAATPISRSDTNSAASTQYAVRYHNVSSPSPAIPEEETSHQDNHIDATQGTGFAVPSDIPEESNFEPNTTDEESQTRPSEMEAPDQGLSSGRQLWQTVANPFKRRRAEPPAEVAAQIAESNARRSPAERYYSLRDRMNAFTVAQRRRLTGRAGTNNSPPMPVTFIPAQPRASMVGGPSSETAERGASPDDRTSDNENDTTDAGREESLNNMPVTFIPPPVRGGRTWSPDELDNDNNTTSGDGQTSSEGNSSGENRSNSTPVQATQANDNVHSTRGSLIISESPARIRDGASSNSPGLLRRNRPRGTTMDSISDRLNSVSPASVVQVQSASNTSQSIGNQEAARQVPDGAQTPVQSRPSENNTGSSKSS